MGGLAEYESGRFRPLKGVQEDSLFVQSNPKSTQYKDKWAVEVFRNWQAAREQKFGFLHLTREACSKIMMFTVLAPK